MSDPEAIVNRISGNAGIIAPAEAEIKVRAGFNDNRGFKRDSARFAGSSHDGGEAGEGRLRENQADIAEAIGSNGGLISPLAGAAIDDSCFAQSGSADGITVYVHAVIVDDSFVVGVPARGVAEPDGIVEPKGIALGAGI